MMPNETIQAELEDKIGAIREFLYEAMATPVSLGMVPIRERLIKIRSRMDELFELEADIRRILKIGNVATAEDLYDKTIELSVAAESLAGALLELSVALGVSLV